jgi:hypothetical protein
MRKLSLSLAAWLALFMGACSCGIEKKAVEDLKATHDLIFPEYLKMVESSNMSSDQKARRKAMVKSATDLVEALRRAVD